MSSRPSTPDRGTISARRGGDLRRGPLSRGHGPFRHRGDHHHGHGGRRSRRLHLPGLHVALPRAAHGGAGPGEELDELASHRRRGVVLRQHPRRRPGGPEPGLRRVRRRQVHGAWGGDRRATAPRSSTASWPGWSASSSWPMTPETTSSSSAASMTWVSPAAGPSSTTGVASVGSRPSRARATAGQPVSSDRLGAG